MSMRRLVLESMAVVSAPVFLDVLCDVRLSTYAVGTGVFLWLLWTLYRLCGEFVNRFYGANGGDDD